MKKVLKIDRPVHPISLAPRKKASSQLAQPSPQHKIDWQNVVLKPIDTNRSQNNALLSTMRKELNTVRQDVEKIAIQEPMSETKVTARMELQILRDQIAQRREIEQELKRQVRELKSRITTESQREENSLKVRKLQTEIEEKRRLESESEEKYIMVTAEFSKLQTEKNCLEKECLRLESLLKETANKRTNDQAVQHTQDEVFELRKRLHETQKQKSELSSKLKEKEAQIKRTIEDCQVSIREKDIKYNSCLNQFKKLELKIGRSKDQSLGQLKTKIEQLEVALETVGQANDRLRQENNELQIKFNKGKVQIEEQRKFNEDLATKITSSQNEIVHNNQNHREVLSTLNKQLVEARSEAEAIRLKYDQKCKELLQPTQKPISMIQNQELHRAKLQILSFEININKLTNQLQKSKIQLQSTLQLSSQKDIYIKELEKRKDGIDNTELLENLQKKCRELCDQQIKIVQQYQEKVQKLERELAKAEESNRERSNQQQTNDFDEAIRKQITQNQQTKELLRLKNEEVIQLKTQNEELKRKASSIKSQTEIDRLKGMTEEKSLKCHFQITIDNLKNEIQSQKRKFQTLQRKAEFRSDDLKKKDQFIQHVIIGKIAKSENDPEGQYIKKELAKFFSVNYQVKLLAAQQRIKQLQNRSNEK